LISQPKRNCGTGRILCGRIDSIPAGQPGQTRSQVGPGGSKVVGRHIGGRIIAYSNHNFLFLINFLVDFYEYAFEHKHLCPAQAMAHNRERIPV
jgi:hypothetical protein